MNEIEFRYPSSGASLFASLAREAPPEEMEEEDPRTDEQELSDEEMDHEAQEEAWRDERDTIDSLIAWMR